MEKSLTRVSLTRGLGWLRRGWHCLLLLTLYTHATLGTAAAHTGAPPTPADLWQAWNWDPWLLGSLLVVAYLYGRGVVALWQRAGWGRGITSQQLVLFSLGMLTLVVALISPLDALSNALFSAHMVQHMLLIYVAPLFFVLGAPPVLLMWALPKPWRRPLNQWWRQGWWHEVSQQLGRWLLNPLTIWALFALVLWIWHAPVFYQAAVLNQLIHVLEHISFFSVSLLFCWLLVYAGRSRHMGYGQILLIIFTTAMHSGLLGALLTFAATPLYPVYAATVQSWGLTLLVDQQLAGVVMWIPVGFFYLVATLVLVARWLRELDQAQASPPATLVQREL